MGDINIRGRSRLRIFNVSARILSYAYSTLRPLGNPRKIPALLEDNDMAFRLVQSVQVFPSSFPINFSMLLADVSLFLLNYLNRSTQAPQFDLLVNNRSCPPSHEFTTLWPSILMLNTLMVESN